MDWKNNLTNAINKAADNFLDKPRRLTAREQFRNRLESMDAEELQEEQVYIQHELLNRLESIDREVTRIRNNVVFFFWLAMLVIGFWVIFIVIGGGILAALSGALG